MNLIEKRQQRAKYVKQARDILDVAEQEERSLSGEEEQKYQRYMDEVDKLGDEIKREERQQAIESELEQRETVNKPDPKQREERTGRASDEYREAFWNFIRTGNARELRAQNIATAADGGNLVPNEFEKTLIQGLADVNVMRNLATVVPTSSGTLSIPAVSSHGSAVWTAESAVYTEGDDAFDQLTLSAHKATTLVKVTEELINDSAFNMETYLRGEFARRLGELEEAAFVNGDGSGKPTGIISGATVGVTAAANNAITSDELLTTYHSLKRAYRKKATWMMADSTALVLRKLKDNNGQYMWQAGLQVNQPDKLLGRPIEYSDSVPAIGSATKPIAFGDMKYYWIADRVGMSVQRLNELYAANGQIGFRAFKRTDGKLTLAEAVQVLQMAV